MTRIAIDADVALRPVSEGVLSPHPLVGPSVLRSHALAILHRQVSDGLLPEGEGRRRLEALAGLRIRLLGDRVSRATAWTLAARLDGDTAQAEYLAVARLQSDLLVTASPGLIAAAEGVVAVGTWDDLEVGPR